MKDDVWMKKLPNDPNGRNLLKRKVEIYMLKEETVRANLWGIEPDKEDDKELLQIARSSSGKRLSKACWHKERIGEAGGGWDCFS